MIFSHFHGKKSGSSYSGYVPSGTPKMWYDASQLEGLSDNDPVAAIPDLSGNGINLAQAEPTDKPTYQTSVQNGLPSVRFTANLSIGTGLTDFSQPNTVFLVAKVTTVATNDYLCGGINGGRNDILTPNSNWGLYAGDVVESTVPVDTNPHVISVLFNGASTVFRIDGREIYIGDPGDLAIGDFQLGRFNASSFIGDIFEVVVYDGAEDPAANEQGLAAKWGIPLTTPFVPAGAPLAWWDASQLVGFSNNDPVAQIDDMSANSNHLLQSTPDLKPLYKTNIQNGLPAVLADGTDDIMSLTWPSAVTQPMTYQIVLKLVSFSSDDAVFSGSTPAYGNQFHAYISGTVKWSNYAGSRIYSIEDVDTNIHVITTTFNGASSYIKVDSGSKSIGNPGSQGEAAFHLFNRADGPPRPTNMYFMEMLVYDSDLSDANVAANVTGLMTKWGI